MKVTIAVILCVLWCAGCSFTTYERLGRGYHPETVPRCSASLKPIVVDATVATALLAFSAYQLGTLPAELQRDPADARAGMISSGVMLAMAAASAYDGLVMRRNCRRARSAHDEWLPGGRS